MTSDATFKKTVRRGKPSKNELSHLKRTLKIIAECHRALIRAADETTLLNDICQIIVEQGGYPLVWVGFPEKDAPYRILPAAAVGSQTNYLKDIFISWENNEFGQAPAGVSLRTGNPQVSNDIAGDPAFKPWLDRIQESGLESVIALPLRRNTPASILGTLVIYSDLKQAFSPEEIEMLSILSQNLAFGIFGLREKASRQQTENAFAEQQLLLRTLMDFMPDTIYIKDENGRFLLANQAISKLMNAARPEDILQKTDFDFYPPELAQKYHDDEQNVIHSGQPLINMVEPVVPEDGLFRWFISTKIPFRDQQNKIKGIVGIGRDITQLKNLENDLQKARAELEERVDQRTLELKNANLQLAGLYQISQAITGALQLDVVLNEIVLRTVELIACDTCVILLLDDTNETLSIRCAYGLSEEVIRGTRDRVGESIAGRVVLTGQPIIANNLPQDTRFFNPSARNEGLKAGVSVPLIVKERAIGTLDVFSKTNPEAFNQEHVHLLCMLAGQAAIAIENARLFGQVEQARGELEQRVEKRTGELLRINSRLQMEIVERKRAEAEYRSLNLELENRVMERTRRLQESETFFRSLFEGSPDGIMIIDPHSSDVSWKIVDVSPEACRMNGYTREELVGHSIDILHPTPEKDTAKRVARLERFHREGLIHTRSTHRRKDGSFFLIDSASSLVTIDGRELVIGFDRDITEQVKTEMALKQAHDELERRVAERTIELANTNNELLNEINERTLIEKALRESGEQFKRLINTASEGVWVLDFEGRTVFVNARMAEMLGYSTSDLIDTDFEDYLLPEDRSDHHRHMQTRAAGFSEQFERRLLRKDGKIIWTLVSATPHIDEDGHFQGSMAMFADITEYKKAEKIREILYQISQAANSAAKLEDLFHSIHHSLAELMPVENMYIALYDAVNDLFNFPYFIDQKDEQPSSEKPGKGMTGYVFRTGKALLVRHDQLDDLFTREDVYQLGSMAVDWLGVPLKSGNHSIGVLVIQSYNEAVRYGENEKSIIEFVSNQIAMAIERKQSEEALRRKLEELIVLHEIATTSVEAVSEEALINQSTRILANAFSADNCGILLWDEQEEKLFVQPSYVGLNLEQMKMEGYNGKGIIGSVFASGQSMRIADVRLSPNYLIMDPRVLSELCVPLKVGERVIGVINIESKRLDAFSYADESLLETIASQMATAIEKFRLFDETRRHLQRLNALHTIDKVITSSLELPFTLGVIIDQGINLLGMDAGDVLMLDLNAQTMQQVVARGFRTGSPQRYELRLSGKFVNRLVLERSAILIPDLEQSHETFAEDLQLGREGFRAYFGVPILAKGQVKGVLEIFSRAPVNVRPEWTDFLVSMAAQAAIAIDNTSLFNALQRSNQELTVAYDATLEGWTRSLKLRDEDTENHSQQVTDLTLTLARRMGINHESLINVRRGALLHDIGKIGIPDRILLKPGRLTEEEWEVMRKHPQYAFDLLYPIPYLRPVLDIPFRHHEKWDGSGYPHGLKGEQIPLAARIFAVVDVWQALISDRPYRPAWKEADALAYIQANSGTQFDPYVVDVFLKWHEETTRAD